MVHKKEMLVVVMERRSPFPPVYPSPLIYTVTADPANDGEILAAVAHQRCLDFAEDDDGEVNPEVADAVAEGLELIMAFEGDLTPMLDWRT